jgi:hypothetical protein
VAEAEEVAAAVEERDPVADVDAEPELVAEGEPEYVVSAVLEADAEPEVVSV